MLLAASWAEELRRLLGMRGVSQIWDEIPAWYFWFQDAPGAYQLSYDEALDLDLLERGIRSALFEVKCFPVAAHEAYPEFSPDEREYVSSALFDETGTPHYAARDRIPAELFTVGALAISLSAEHEGSALFTLEALDRGRVRRSPNFPRRSRRPTGSPNPDLLRNVPSWDCTRQLFDRIVALHAYHNGQYPQEIRASRAQGLEWIVDCNGAVSGHDTDATQMMTVSVLFKAAPDETFRILTRIMDELHTAPDQNQAFRWTAGDDHAHHQPSDSDQYAHSWWWKVPGMEKKTLLDSTCGCH
jgi:hypothetical protein